MKREHPELEVMVAALERPETDPTRQHLAGCPRCQTLVANYRDFLSPHTDLSQAERREASDQLAQVLSRERSERERVSSARHAASPQRAGSGARPSNGRSWLDALLHPAVARPALALAALAIVAVIAVTTRSVEPPAPVLRGAPQGSATPKVVVQPPRAQPAGATDLAWAPVPNADSYAVELITPELETLRTIEVGGATTVSLGADDVAPLDSLFFRVVARRQGAVIAESPLETLIIRRH